MTTETTISQIAQAFATQLATINGLRTYAYQPEQLNPPVAFPTLTGVTYHKAFQGGDIESEWTINVVVGRYTDRTAHATLDLFLSYNGSQSIRATIEADRTLGGLVQTLLLSNGANIQPLAVADAEFLEISFNCIVKQ